MTKQIIMTSPASFGVQYDINPWMHGNLGAVDINRAVQQWSELRNVLWNAGVDVIVMPRAPDYCPDAVFTANAGLLYQNTFIPSRFKHEERQVEEPYFINWFLDHKYNVNLALPTDRNIQSFEGAGDALFSVDRTNLWYGFGFRSSFNYKHVLEELLPPEVMVRPLQLVDPRWYHLDTCFCPLDTGHLLWYPGAFTEYAQYTIELWYGENAIAVSEEDALRFACNAVSVDDSVVLPLVSIDLVSELVDHNLVPIQTNMSEFLKSGGACKCLTLEVIA